MTESERKRFSDLCSRKAEGTTPLCFLLKVGMRKVLSSEEERRDLEGLYIGTSSATY